MAETATDSSTSRNGGNPPIGFMIAVLVGMSHEEIERGLREGWVARPPGAPDDWVPPWASTNGGSDNGDANSPPNSSENGGTTPAVDRAQIQRWMHGLDPALTSSAFSVIWSAAGASDQLRAANLFGYLRRVILESADDTPVIDENGIGNGADAVAALSAFIADPAHRANVVSLAGKDGAEIASLARTDIGYRYALMCLDAVALTGNRALFASHNANGELDRFDADTGEPNISDSWITDRSKFLAWKMNADGGGDMSIPGTENWTFTDRTLRDANGNPMKLEITAKDGSSTVNQVVFGADGGESLKGGKGTDRIYGGNGDDIIRGGAGSDHLEGGRGDDSLLGGAGSDELVGGRGDDELDGASGADRLQGNSGDDTLTGGRGNDRLEGGAGHDVYVVDPGDGADTIVDSDGDGAVQFDGSTLDGAATKTSGKYVSADGRAIYSFIGDPAEGGTLSVNFYASGDSGANVTPTNSIKIKAWKNGDLGITLGDGSTGALVATDETPASDTSADNATDSTASTTSDPTSSVDSPDATIPDTANPDTVILPGTATNENALDPAVATDVTAADISSVDNAFPAVPEPPDVGSSLVDAGTVDDAVRAFAGMPEAPDLMTTPHGSNSHSIGVTPSDLSSAMLDFHDSSDIAHDQVGSEPLPAPMPALTTPDHTASITGGGSGNLAGKGMGQKQA